MNTYHAKMIDGTNPMLRLTGWCPAVNGHGAYHIALAELKDGRKCAVFFNRMPDGTLIAHESFGLRSRVIDEVPF